MCGGLPVTRHYSTGRYICSVVNQNLQSCMSSEVHTNTSVHFLWCLLCDAVLKPVSPVKAWSAPSTIALTPIRMCEHPYIISLFCTFCRATRGRAGNWILLPTRCQIFFHKPSPQPCLAPHFLYRLKFQQECRCQIGQQETGGFACRWVRQECA